MSSLKELIEAAVPGKWCPTCGEQKNYTDFSDNDALYDGLSAECRRCEGHRETARRLDGLTGPRDYAIEGEQLTRRPMPSIPVLLWRRTLDAASRRRPTSGLQEVFA